MIAIMALKWVLSTGGLVCEDWRVFGRHYWIHYFVADLSLSLSLFAFLWFLLLIYVCHSPHPHSPLSIWIRCYLSISKFPFTSNSLSLVFSYLSTLHTSLPFISTPHSLAWCIALPLVHFCKRQERTILSWDKQTKKRLNHLWNAVFCSALFLSKGIIWYEVWDHQLKAFLIDSSMFKYESKGPIKANEISQWEISQFLINNQKIVLWEKNGDWIWY